MRRSTAPQWAGHRILRKPWQAARRHHWVRRAAACRLLPAQPSLRPAAFGPAAPQRARWTALPACWAPWSPPLARRLWPFAAAPPMWTLNVTRPEAALREGQETAGRGFGDPRSSVPALRSGAMCRHGIPCPCGVRAGERRRRAGEAAAPCRQGANCGMANSAVRHAHAGLSRKLVCPHATAPVFAPARRATVAPWRPGQTCGDVRDHLRGRRSCLATAPSRPAQAPRRRAQVPPPPIATAGLVC